MRFWVLALAASLAASGATAKAKKRHTRPPEAAESAAPVDPDGAWRVDATTTVGDCPSLIPTRVQIAEGRVASAEGAPVESWGYVDESGNIVARFTGAGERVVRFHGALKGSRGSGAWSSSTDMCGGTWRAARE